MRTLFLWIAALAVVPGLLHAQSAVGTWQGTLHVEQIKQDLKIVMKISTTGNDKFAGTFYSIDQNATVAMNNIALNGSALKLEVPGIAGSYDGKLGADGNSMTGTWKQGQLSIPLDMVRATPQTAWAVPEPPPPPKQMTEKDPSFEVATIKPSNPATVGIGITVRGRQVITINTPLRYLITFAYSLHPNQVLNAPRWIEEEKYDIVADPEGSGMPGVAQMRIMMQKLLADRFQLKFHKDKKELSVYTITVAKNGSKVTPSAADPNSLPGLGFAGPGRMIVRNGSMGEFADVLQSVVLDKPVLDQTGLRAKYDFTLTFQPDASQQNGALAGLPTAPAADNAAAPPDLFTAIQQQLGLKLESTKAAAEVYVIDKVEKPSAN